MNTTFSGYFIINRKLQYIPPIVKVFLKIFRNVNELINGFTISFIVFRSHENESIIKKLY